MTDQIPPPGSPAARARKCSCAMLDNGYGKGAYIDATGKAQYWINADCPLHGTPKP